MRTYRYSHFNITLGHRVVWESLTFRDLQYRLMWDLNANICDPIISVND